MAAANPLEPPAISETLSCVALLAPTRFSNAFVPSCVNPPTAIPTPPLRALDAISEPVKALPASLDIPICPTPPAIPPDKKLCAVACVFAPFGSIMFATLSPTIPAINPPTMFVGCRFSASPSPMSFINPRFIIECGSVIASVILDISLASFNFPSTILARSSGDFLRKSSRCFLVVFIGTSLCCRISG